MLEAALRDLFWRRRRFLIAVVGVSGLFGMTLVLTGVTYGFNASAKETLLGFGVDTWVVQEDAAGPFLGASPIDAGLVDEVAALEGVRAAGPFVFGRQTHESESGIDDVNVFGASPGGPAMPAATEGREPAEPGELMVSTTLGVDIGDSIRFGPVRFEVVGLVRNSTALGGVANVFMVASDAQQVVFNGASAVSAVAVVGVSEKLPPGTRAFGYDGALDDLTRMIDQAGGAIAFIAVVLWLVAALIIGWVLYLSALERVRDFAIFKSVGVPSSRIVGGLAAQAAIIAMAAAIGGSLLSQVLAPGFPMRVETPLSAFVLLFVVAVVIATVGSLAAIRRVLRVDPAVAFGGP